MAIRNFYIAAEIDGRSTQLTGGPAARDGGMSLVLSQRDKGRIRTALSIECDVDPITGKLNTYVYDDTGVLLLNHTTSR